MQKKAPSERKVTMPWEDLASILRKSNNLFPEEVIDGITLVKPKQLLIYLQRQTLDTRGASNVSK